MQCPVCDDRMKEVERLGVSIDICPGCKGVWLDRGELEKLIAISQQSDAGGGQMPVAAPGGAPTVSFLGRNDQDSNRARVDQGHHERDHDKHRDHDHDRDRYSSSEHDRGHGHGQYQNHQPRSWFSNLLGGDD